jgi:hypothetical protein
MKQSHADNPGLDVVLAVAVALTFLTLLVAAVSFG